MRLNPLTSEEALFCHVKVDYGIIEETAKELYIRALCDLPPDVRRALKKAYERETKPNAKEVFKAMLKAVDIADQKKTLVCQDTGLPIYMVKTRFPCSTGTALKSRTASVSGPDAPPRSSHSAAVPPTPSPG